MCHPKKIAIFVFAGILWVLSINPAYAWTNTEKIEYLFDVRGDDGDILLNRLSSFVRPGRLPVEYSLFLEMYWNFEISDWEKISAGTGLNFRFLRYLSFSQSIQTVSGELLDYLDMDVNNLSPETTSILSAEFPIVKRLSIFLSESYSVNLEEGNAEFCESIIKFKLKINDRYSADFGWRHTDRVHEFDTDYISSSISLNF